MSQINTNSQKRIMNFFVGGYVMEMICYLFERYL